MQNKRINRCSAKWNRQVQREKVKGKTKRKKIYKWSERNGEEKRIIMKESGESEWR